LYNPEKPTLLSLGQPVLQGRYHVEEFIGSGAIAEVYRANYKGSGGVRALKVISRDSPGLSENEFSDLSSRFRLEGQLYEQLKDNPHILKVYELEEDGDILIQVLDFAEGGNLADYIAQNQPLSIAEVIRISQDIANGLSALHAQNIVHRDLKPSNVLLDAKKVARIADLGFAQAQKLSGRSHYGSLSGHHPGTPAYMSPEQEYEKGYLQFNSDVYAFGCLVFEMLTGELYKDQRPGISLQDIRSDVPDWLDKLVSQCVSVERNDRPWDGEELCQLLLGGVRKKEGGPDVEEGLVEEETEPHSDEITRPFWKRIPLWARILFVSFVAASAVFGALIYGGGIAFPFSPVEQGSTLTVTENLVISSETPTVTIAPSQTLTYTHTPTLTQTQTPLPTLTPTATATFTPKPKPIAFIQFATYARTEPGLGYPIIASISMDDELTVEGKSHDGEWLYTYIQEGLYGWIQLDAVEELFDIEAVDVISPLAPVADSENTFLVTFWNSTSNHNLYLDYVSLGRQKPGARKAARLDGGVHSIKICYTYNWYSMFGSTLPNEWREGECASDTFFVSSDLFWEISSVYSWIIQYPTE